jgi:GT2 family glycosyltransferase
MIYEPEPPPQISIVIPVLGRYDELDRVLARLERQSCGPDAFDVTVVSDAAEPDPQRIEATIGARNYQVVHLRARSPGAAWARELGWSHSAAPVVLFIDSDILADPSLVEEHLDWHRQRPEPEVAILGSVRWARGVRVTAFMRWIERGVLFDFERIEGDDAGWGRFYTANVSVKRRMLERVGGFDADTFPFLYEDTDLAYRMHLEGMQLLYNPRAAAEHLQTVSLESYRERMAVVARYERRFVERNPGIEPYFHDRFERAAALPKAHGRLAPLIRWISPWLPLIGTRAWLSADHYFSQQLAPAFREAWDAADSSAQAGDPPGFAGSSGRRRLDAE